MRWNMTNQINALLTLQKEVKRGRHYLIYDDRVSVDVTTFFELCRAYHGTDSSKLKISVFSTTTSIETEIEGVKVLVVI